MYDDIPSQIRAGLEDNLSDTSMVPAAMVESWIQQFGYSKQEIMMMLLPVAQHYARSPVSHFQVGAVSMGTPQAGTQDDIGNLYLGASFEFSHESLNLVVHGEQSALNNALLHGETGLQYLSISASPCGYCRQFLYEIPTALSGFTILLSAQKSVAPQGYIERPLTDLLPDAFSPKELGRKNGLMLPYDHGLIHPTSEPLVAEAVAAMNASYAPYSENYSGVSLMRSDGKIYIGRYAENVAYNPSLLPMMSALSQMNLLIPAGSDLNITAACLVEAAAPISQFNASLSALQTVAPGIDLQHVIVQS